MSVLRRINVKFSGFTPAEALAWAGSRVTFVSDNRADLAIHGTTLHP